jgi:hypothetical protein
MSEFLIGLILGFVGGAVAGWYARKTVKEQQ